jgi:hypothetical protein
VLSRLFLAVFGVSRMALKSLILNRLYVCHGRGRGFEPRRPRHKPIRNSGLRRCPYLLPLLRGFAWV